MKKPKPKAEWGTVTRWSEGWGFAKPHARGFDVFLHADKIVEGAPIMRLGALIEFEMGQDLKRPYARNIKVMG